MDQPSSYQDWLQQSKGILFSPARFWKQYDAEKMTVNQILASFLLPWLGLTAMVVFVGVWVNQPQLPYLDLLKMAVVVFARLFFAVFAAGWGFEKLNAALGNLIPFHAAFALVAFAMPMLCLESMVGAFFPDLLMVKLVLAYTMVLFYLGCVNYFNFSKAKAVIHSLLIFVWLLGVSFSVTYLLQIINKPVL